MTRELLVIGLLGLTGGAGCVHAEKTRSQQARERAGAGGGDDRAQEKDSRDAPPEPDGKTRSGEALPHTRPNETITTSRTTQRMFKKEGLEKLQRALADKELPEVKVEPNGKLDAPTQDALRAFQRDQKLPDTGLPDFETVRRLGVKPAELYEEMPPAARGGVQ